MTMVRGVNLRTKKELTLVQVLVWVVVLGISRVERERVKLEKDLKAMGFQGLLVRS